MLLVAETPVTVKVAFADIVGDPAVIETFMPLNV